tara:strand:- start:244 stop:510 length:267 start_codon:yes stop_codon:yes gene_type:complete
MSDIEKEMDKVIEELKKRGLNQHSHEGVSDEASTTGLGDAVEATLQKFGITEERFKKWFALKDCNCSSRKAWLNNLFSWKNKVNDEQG